jgi:hypothetical protein
MKSAMRQKNQNDTSIQLYEYKKLPEAGFLFIPTEFSLISAENASFLIVPKIWLIFLETKLTTRWVCESLSRRRLLSGAYTPRVSHFCELLPTYEKRENG